MEQLRARSTKAVCGAFEREVIVKSENAAKAIATIKKHGFLYVGKGPAGLGRTKIWFVARGAAML